MKFDEKLSGFKNLNYESVFQLYYESHAYNLEIT